MTATASPSGAPGSATSHPGVRIIDATDAGTRPPCVGGSWLVPRRGVAPARSRRRAASTGLQGPAGPPDRRVTLRPGSTRPAHADGCPAVWPQVSWSGAPPPGSAGSGGCSASRCGSDAEPSPSSPPSGPSAGDAGGSRWLMSLPLYVGGRLGSLGGSVSRGLLECGGAGAPTRCPRILRRPGQARWNRLLAVADSTSCESIELRLPGRPDDVVAETVGATLEHALRHLGRS